MKAAIFDFDGTISTLRYGWEKVMLPLMLEVLEADESDKELQKKVEDYIDKSTGIQTIHQMIWLKEQVELRGLKAEDEWSYKDEYNRRLMEQVSERIAKIKEGTATPEDYIIKGAPEFLRALKDRNIDLYLASGTDHADVCNEAALLGVASLFTGIKGAPERQVSCPKEAAINALIKDGGLNPKELLMVGDGKVEISLGVKIGAFTIGLASDEERREGINPLKHEKLTLAGADLIVGDFVDIRLPLLQ